MLLRNAWLPLGVALVLAGLVGSAGAVVGLGVFLLLAGGLARAWAARSLDSVTFERRLTERRAFPGDTIHVRYRVTNRKALPLPFLELREQLPEPLCPPELDLPPSSATGAVLYKHATHLRWHERVTWPLDLQCPTRGYFRLGPALLRSGDGFGLFTNSRDEPATDGVVVYPRTVPLPDLGLPSARPLGERKGRQRIFEDPLRIAGVRDYEPGDSIRRIDWKATARRGALQSRLYEPSTTQHLLVALNIDTLTQAWQGYVPDLLEANIVLAASLARWAHDERYAVGLLANGSLSESDRPINIAPGRAPDQLVRILEALGGIGPMTMTSLAALLEEEGHRLPFGVTIAAVSAQMPEPLAAALRRLHDSGHQVTVLTTVNDDWAGILGGIPVQRIDRRALEPTRLQAAAPA